MSRTADRPGLPAAVTDVVDAASGRAHRDDPVLPGTGGPAGNGQLTAWLGLALLVLFVAELVTLLDVRGLITWHLTLGLLLIPPALAKTATTGWRMVRYYTGAPAYREAGPPPLLLRLLGPLVVLGTLAVLGTGVLLVALGPDTGRSPLFGVLGRQISPLTLHQASFLGWAVVTGLHVVGRLVPAVRLAGGRRLPGTGRRTGALVVTAAVAALVAVVVVGLASSWTSGGLERHRGRDGGAGTAATGRAGTG